MIHELPYEIAMDILTNDGYTPERADEIITISRGESTGDRVAVYDEEDD